MYTFLGQVTVDDFEERLSGLMAFAQVMEIQQRGDIGSRLTEPKNHQTVMLSTAYAM